MEKNVLFDVIYKQYLGLSEKMESTIDFRDKIQIFRGLTNLLCYMESLLSGPELYSSSFALQDKPSRKTFVCRLVTILSPAAKRVSIKKRGPKPICRLGHFYQNPCEDRDGSQSIQNGS